MARQIVAVRMNGGGEHRHIAGVAYVTTGARTFSAGTMSLKTVLTNMEVKGDFFTRDYKGIVAQVVAVAEDGTPCIRTKKDGVLTDNLLRLPRYKSD